MTTSHFFTRTVDAGSPARKLIAERIKDGYTLDNITKKNGVYEISMSKEIH